MTSDLLKVMSTVKYLLVPLGHTKTDRSLEDKRREVDFFLLILKIHGGQ